MVWELGSGRKAVKEIGGGVQTLNPEARRERGLDQKRAHSVVGDANHALSLAVLRGVRARHAQLDSMREEESTRGGVIELMAIVTLEDLNSEAELS